MILQCYYIDEAKKNLSDKADSAAIEAGIDSVDWSRLAFLSLIKDDNNRLEGSGSTNPTDGLSLSLFDDGIEHVCEAAPATPQSMLDVFNAYLSEDLERVYRLIYDADRRGLSPETLQELRDAEVATQRGRLLREALADATQLFSAKKYAEYIELISPFETLLGGMDLKKLALARKKSKL